MASTKTTIENVATKTPEQQAMLQSLLDNLSPELLQDLFSGFESYATARDAAASQAGPIDEQDLYNRYRKRTVDPALQSFREDFIPMLQERFNAAGSAGGPSEQGALAIGAERLSSDLARQFEDVYENAQNRQLNAAQVLGGLTSSQFQSAYPYINTATGTDMFQPIARQTTKVSPWEQVLTGFGGGVGKGVGSFLGSKLPLG